MNGRAYACASVGWMLAPPLIWGLIELSGSYDLPFAIVIAGNLVGAGLLLTQVRRNRRSYAQ